jgi:hypothetical protein
MKATVALLLDHDVHNVIRKLAVEVHQKYQIGLAGSQLPPHVSLKQPFSIPSLPPVEAYFDQLAKSIDPVALTAQNGRVIRWGSFCEQLRHGSTFIIKSDHMRSSITSLRFTMLSSMSWRIFLHSPYGDVYFSRDWTWAGAWMGRSACMTHRRASS